MLNTKSAIKSFLVHFKEFSWQRTVELRPYGGINAGEQELKEVSDTGTKMASRHVAEDNIAANQPATDGWVDYDDDCVDGNDHNHGKGCGGVDDDDGGDDQLSIRSSLAVSEVKIVLDQPSVAEHSKAVIIRMVVTPW